MSHWTDEDVRESLEASETLLTQGLSISDESSMELGQNLGKFWTSEHKQGFEAMWHSLSIKDRENLILTVSPHTPTYRGSIRSKTGDDVRGAAWMMPGAKPLTHAASPFASCKNDSKPICNCCWSELHSPCDFVSFSFKRSACESLPRTLPNCWT